VYCIINCEVNSKFPTNLPRFYICIHISPNVWQSSIKSGYYSFHMPCASITKHVSFKIHFQQFRNSNVTAILLCLFNVASSIVTSSITSIFFANSIVTSSITSIFIANSIVTSSITSILRYLLLWTLDARCFRKYRFSDTLSYYLK
jgi:hypothetical protein